GNSSVAPRAAGSEVAERIPLGGPWSFVPVGEELDYAWKTDVSEVELALPAMRVRWEHDANGRLEGWTRSEYDDSCWRRWKIFDAFYAGAGAHRYRSKWDARAISLYDHSGFRTRIGGKGLRCRKTVEVPEGSETGWLAVLTEGAFRLRAGDRAYEGRSEGKPVRFDLDGLRAGPFPIEVEAAEARYILLEGRIGKEGGTRLAIATDRTWEVSLDGRKWISAWEYVAPPEKPCGEPEYPEPRALPAVVWYREMLPPGASAILEPKVEGRWRIWVDGRPQLFLNGEAELEPEDRPRPIVLRARLEDDAQRALLEPIRFRCRPSVQPLGSWTAAGLDWYSGRALYATSFDLAPAHLAPGTRLFVDLGRVGYCAEVWLNRKLAGVRVWPPYRVEVTAFAREGENRLEVVVANLLANRMRWDIFHDVVGVEWNRKWHDGNIVRDAWCLASGLLGPAEVVAERAGDDDREHGAAREDERPR
ncbi:MAG: glycosylhydrolase-like jelly roll fold domain-containing protein, partial [Planctomycetota bacterium]